MPRGRLIVVLLFVVVLLGIFTGKLLWDDYQMDRAEAELPKVVALLDSIELPEGTLQAADVKTSVNEFATSVWRDYKTAVSRAEFKAHLEDEIRVLGFIGSEESLTHGGKLYCYRRGEYEFRLLFFYGQQEGELALSANWYGG